MDDISEGLSKCDICNSEKYTRINGILVCENGHESGDKEANGSQSCSRKRNKGKKSVRKTKDKRVPLKKHYKKGITLQNPYIDNIIYECMQQIIVGEIDLLRNMLDDIPEEFEEVVKELWLMYITISEEKRHMLFDDDRRVMSRKKLGLLDEDVYSSVNNGESKVLNEQRLYRAFVQSTIRSIIAIVYLGCLYLRMDVMPCDMIGWINQGRLAYYNADILVDPAYIQHLVRFEHSIIIYDLMPKHHLYTEDLNEVCSSIAHSLCERFGITFPPMNMGCILLRMVCGLLLPAHFYLISMQIMSMVGFKEEMYFKEAKLTRKMMRYPLFAAAYLTIAVKLVYGLNEFNNDDNNRKGIRAILPFYEEMKLIWHECGLNIRESDRSKIRIRTLVDEENYDDYLRHSSENCCKNLHYNHNVGKKFLNIARDLDKLLSRFLDNEEKGHKKNTYERFSLLIRERCYDYFSTHMGDLWNGKDYAYVSYCNNLEKEPMPVHHSLNYFCETLCNIFGLSKKHLLRTVSSIEDRIEKKVLRYRKKSYYFPKTVLVD